MIYLDTLAQGYEQNIAHEATLDPDSRLLIVNSVSGVGRTTLSQILIKQNGFHRIRNFTTRPPRSDDDDTLYEYFDKTKYFKMKDENRLFCVIHWGANGHFYGISRDELDKIQGKSIYDNTHFGWVVKSQSPSQVYNMWLLATPSTIHQRLTKRGTDPTHEITNRIDFAIDEQKFILENLKKLLSHSMIDSYLWIDDMSADQIVDEISSTTASFFRN